MPFTRHGIKHQYFYKRGEFLVHKHTIENEFIIGIGGLMYNYKGKNYCECPNWFRINKDTNEITKVHLYLEDYVDPKTYGDSYNVAVKHFKEVSEQMLNTDVSYLDNLTTSLESLKKFNL